MTISRLVSSKEVVTTTLCCLKTRPSGKSFLPEGLLHLSGSELSNMLNDRMKLLCFRTIVISLLTIMFGCHDSGPAPSVASKGIAEPAPPSVESKIASPTPKTTAREGKRVLSLRFNEVAERLGVSHCYNNGAQGQSLMVEATGGGVGWFDYDNDGVLDLFLNQGGLTAAKSIEVRPQDMLYRGIDEGGFVAVSEHARVDDGDYSQGVAIADFDNDGFDDLYLTTIRHNCLFRNQGDGTFQNITDSAGVDDLRWSTSAAWGDLDLDGDLDLYVCNYVDFDLEHPKICLRLKTAIPSMCHPRDFNPTPDECFENLGDGTFRPVAKSWKLEGPGNRALGVAIADYNNDGRPDLFVANDTTANFLFLNRQQHQFEETATLLGCALSSMGVAQANMGIAVGDYDRNGYLDLYVTHFSGEWNTLYRNLGPEGFQDRTALLGLVGPTMSKLGFGTVMADFDQNGHDELFVANGHVDSTSTEGDGYEMVAQLFTKVGSRFQECGPDAGEYFQQKYVGRGVALGDFDADGDWDLAVAHQNAPAAILENVSDRGHWLKVHGIGRASSRTPIGMRVILKQGELILMQELAGGTSYCSANQSALIFGLGDSSEPCDLEIRWPKGTTQHLKRVSPNQTLRLLEPIE